MKDMARILSVVIALLLFTSLHAAEYKFSGGALTLMRNDYSVERSFNYNTRIQKKTTKENFSTVDWYWMDADAKVTSDLSFSFRLCNMTASKLNSLNLNETQQDVEWLSFQYGYIQCLEKNRTYRLGLVPVDRNAEPLEVHFTPQKTSWTSFWNSTLGSVRGGAIHWKQINKCASNEVQPAFNIDASFVVSVNNDGAGTTVIQQALTSEVRIEDRDSLDFIVSFPMTRKQLSLTPVLALRTKEDGARPDDGKGDTRFSYGLTGQKKYSSKLTVPFGIGFTSFDNDRTRFVKGHARQDNESMYVRISPNYAVGKGRLVCELKYSTFEDHSKAATVTHKYPSVDVKYISRFKEKLVTLAPRVRFFGEYYKDPNTNVKYSKIRFCPEVVFFLSF
ncbi:MAG: hypothetical protein PHQ23_16055 [Candidatus Wallbacteria bacterium]|nr:hypothetical protein [Candidatus Wallbacteria bacterium]